MSLRACLVTTGQPSTNPRLVKEADALAAAGFDVTVIGARRSVWADESDRELLAGRAWRATVLDPGQSRFGLSRVTGALRHRLARATGARGSDAWLAAAISPVAPMLAAAARAHAADLYIAHNLGALPAALAAATAHGARVGFDAEDFHSGQLTAESPELELTQLAEARWIPSCDYVTAASPLIAEHYASLRSHRPAVILNVFPMADRPAAPLPVAQGPFRLYWFSQTIGPHRGLENVVDAMGILREHPIELHLRGEWQRGYESEFRQRAVNASLSSDRIVAMPPAPASEMVRLAAPFHAGLATETGHTVNSDIALANKLYTYVLAGVPVIASATRAQRAFCDEAGPAASSYHPGQPAALALALRPWLEDHAAHAIARQRAWDLGTDRFNWDIEREAFLRVVDHVLPGCSSRRGERRELAS